MERFWRKQYRVLCMNLNPKSNILLELKNTFIKLIKTTFDLNKKKLFFSAKEMFSS